MAPVVPPGRYTVPSHGRRPHGNHHGGVQRNPWITDVTDADLVAQYTFGLADSGQGERGQWSGHRDSP